MAGRRAVTVVVITLTVVLVGLIVWLVSSRPTAEPEPTSDASPGAAPSPSAPRAPVARVETTFEVVAEGLGALTGAVAADGDPRLFVLERHGVIRVVSGGRLRDEPFLDIVDRVTTSGLGHGLIGLAFHPRYRENGRFFLHYSRAGTGETVIAEYRVSSEPDRADPASQQILLTVSQPGRVHNGGMLLFGPDGYLWIGLGDGGEPGNGQDPSTLLGSILRIDVDPDGDGPRPYAIPPDNPFAQSDRGAPEVWAYGLRNPFRFDIDPDERLLYIADVGQEVSEWVNVVPADQAGLNHGWPVTEGSHCHDPPTDCSTDGLVRPVLEYANTGADCAIVGGSAYRGQDLVGWQGHFFYADFCGGWVRSFRFDPDSGQVVDQAEHATPGSLGQVQSFGRDVDGELIVVNGAGTIYRIRPGG